MHIYRFQRADGSQDCDFTVPAGATILDDVAADSEIRLVKLIHMSEGRMRALAERARAEQFPAPTAATLPRTFLGRLRWLFTGK